MKKTFEIKTAQDFAGLLAVITKKTKKYVEKEGGFKPFDVTIEEHKEGKEPKHLNGFNRVCGHIAPYLKEMTGEIWSKDRVKQYIKLRAGFVDVYEGTATTRSCKDATLEDMLTLIAEVIAFGESMDIPDCQLKNAEQRALEEYYNNK
jgi:hypothetical protein